MLPLVANLARFLIVGGVDRRRMADSREGLSIQKCLMGRLMMKWARHVERIDEDSPTKKASDHQTARKTMLEGHQEGRDGR